MKKLFSIFVLAAAALSATPATTEVTLQDVGSSPLSDGSYYIGPYTLSINGQNHAALCVDFDHDTNPVTTWTAYVNTSHDFSGSYHSDNPDLYRQEAYLYNLITKPNADRIDIQHAAWNITDPNYTADSAAQSFVDLAKANFGSVNLNGFQVLSDVNHQQQEFLVFDSACAAPEPSSFAMLGGGLLLGVGLIRRNRKKTSAAPSFSLN